MCVPLSHALANYLFAGACRLKSAYAGVLHAGVTVSPCDRSRQIEHQKELGASRQDQHAHAAETQNGDEAPGSERDRISQLRKALDPHEVQRSIELFERRSSDAVRMQFSASGGLSDGSNHAANPWSTLCAAAHGGAMATSAGLQVLMTKNYGRP